MNASDSPFLTVNMESSAFQLTWKVCFDSTSKSGIFQCSSIRKFFYIHSLSWGKQSATSKMLWKKWLCFSSNSDSHKAQWWVQLILRWLSFYAYFHRLSDSTIFTAPIDSTRQLAHCSRTTTGQCTKSHENLEVVSSGFIFSGLNSSGLTLDDQWPHHSLIKPPTYHYDGYLCNLYRVCAEFELIAR